MPALHPWQCWHHSAFLSFSSAYSTKLSLTPNKAPFPTVLGRRDIRGEERLRDSSSCPTWILELIGEAIRFDWPAVPATNPVEHATNRVAGPATLDQRRSKVKRQILTYPGHASARLKGQSINPSNCWDNNSSSESAICLPDMERCDDSEVAQGELAIVKEARSAS